MRHLYDKKRLIYHNRASLQHLKRNKLNVEYITCDKLEGIFNIYIYVVLRICELIRFIVCVATIFNGDC